MQFWKDWGAHGVAYLFSLLTTLANLPANLQIFGPHTAVIVGVAGIIVTAVNNVHNLVSNPTAGSGAGTLPPASGSTPPKQAGRASIAPLATLIVLCVGACAAIPVPQTFNQKLEVGYGTATAVLTTTDTLLKAGKLSSAVANNIESQDNNLKAALDIARTTYAANQTDGGNQLATALTALNALQSYLTGVK